MESGRPLIEVLVDDEDEDEGIGMSECEDCGDEVEDWDLKEYDDPKSGHRYVCESCLDQFEADEEDKANA